MLDIIREAPLGQAICFVSRNRLLRYPEERPDFELSAQYTALLKRSEVSKLRGHGSPLFDRNDSRPNENDIALRHQSSENVGHNLEMLGMVRTMVSVHTAPYSNERVQSERVLNIERTKSLPIIPQKTLDGIVLVDLYTTDDPANPQNRSSFKKGFIVFILCIYTWTVYCAGPIYATPTTGIVQHLCNTLESVQLLPLPVYRFTYLHMALETFFFPL